jgi:hypothetical protein
VQVWLPTTLRYRLWLRMTFLSHPHFYTISVSRVHYLWRVAIKYILPHKCHVDIIKKIKKTSKISTSFDAQFKMTKALSNGKSQNYHLNANDEFFTSLTSKFITYFIVSFTLGIKIQVNRWFIKWKWAYTLDLGLEVEVHSIWVQECKNNFFFEVGWGGQCFQLSSLKKTRIAQGLWALALILSREPLP